MSALTKKLETARLLILCPRCGEDYIDVRIDPPTSNYGVCSKCLTRVTLAQVDAKVTYGSPQITIIQVIKPYTKESVIQIDDIDDKATVQCPFCQRLHTVTVVRGPE